MGDWIRGRDPFVATCKVTGENSLVNKCNPNPCEVNQICTDVDDGYACHCNAGFHQIGNGQVVECVVTPKCQILSVIDQMPAGSYGLEFNSAQWIFLTPTTESGTMVQGFMRCNDRGGATYISRGVKFTCRVNARGMEIWKFKGNPNWEETEKQCQPLGSNIPLPFIP